MRKNSWLLVVSVLALMSSFEAIGGVYEDILVAARDDRADVVMDLLSRGMDPNTSDPAGTTLLMFAAGNGNEQLLEFLLRSRANMLKQNRYGDTAVALAALNGHLPIVRRLVAAGADIANTGWNALHYAAFNGHVEIVRFLVSKKTDLNIRAPNGNTALMLAARNGHKEVVSMLVEAGADLDLDDREGNTAFSMAIKAGNTEIADQLRGNGAGK